MVELSSTGYFKDGSNCKGASLDILNNQHYGISCVDNEVACMAAGYAFIVAAYAFALRAVLHREKKLVIIYLDGSS